MSQIGHSRRFLDVHDTSGSPSIAEMILQRRREWSKGANNRSLVMLLADISPIGRTSSRVISMSFSGLVGARLASALSFLLRASSHRTLQVE
jgi:hypothetical protein